jgi:hypothetical protein
MNDLAKLVAILTLLSFTGTGCGDEAENEVVSAVEEFTLALAAGDGETTCSLMTPHAKDELLAAVTASDQSGPHFENCAAAASTLGGEEPPPEVEVEEVSIDGATASAEVEGSSDRLEVVLQRQLTGDWLVSDPKELLFGPPDGS